jgi:uncharacterized protein (DUF433 family)
MDWKEHIAIDADVLAGRPRVAGTRIAVEQVLRHLSNGWPVDQLLEEYPTLTREGVLACIAFAAAYLGSERLAAIPG